MWRSGTIVLTCRWGRGVEVGEPEGIVEEDGVQPLPAEHRGRLKQLGSFWGGQDVSQSIPFSMSGFWHCSRCVGGAESSANSDPSSGARKVSESAVAACKASVRDSYKTHGKPHVTRIPLTSPRSTPPLTWTNLDVLRPRTYRIRPNGDRTGELKLFQDVALMTQRTDC